MIDLLVRDNELKDKLSELAEMSCVVQEQAVIQLLELGAKIETLYKRMVHGKFALIDSESNLGFLFELEDSKDENGKITVTYTATPHRFTERELTYPPED